MTNQIEMANQAIAKEVAECLHTHYPGHAWGVNANVEQGIVQVFNLALSGQHGFTLHINDLQQDPSMRLTIRAGGEMLERYQLSRGGKVEHQYDALEYDLRGDAIQS